MDAESQGEPDKDLVKFTGSKLSEYVPDSELEISGLDVANEIEEFEKKWVSKKKKNTEVP